MRLPGRDANEAVGAGVGAESQAIEASPDGDWTQLLVEWFEEQAALLIGELERGGDG